MNLKEFKERFKYDSHAGKKGEGGFAEVFKAEDTWFATPKGNRTVALKFFNLAGEKKYTLRKEISLAFSLQHSNICRYYELALIETMNIHGDNAVTEVAVMEYLDGGHVNTFAAAHPEFLDKILTDILKGLAYLHGNGVIHRDIKPGNVLVCYLKKNSFDDAVNDLVSKEYYETRRRNEIELVQAGEFLTPCAKITDFGISKALGSDENMSSRIIGTLAYMAPEQIEPVRFGVNKKIGTNADIWSFGVMAYELVTGEKLFENLDSENTGQAITRILGDPFEEKLNSLAPKYKRLLQKCLVRKAGERTSDCNELIRILKDVLQEMPEAEKQAKSQAPAAQPVQPVGQTPEPVKVSPETGDGRNGKNESAGGLESTVVVKPGNIVNAGQVAKTPEGNVDSQERDEESDSAVTEGLKDGVSVPPVPKKNNALLLIIAVAVVLIVGVIIASVQEGQSESGSASSTDTTAGNSSSMAPSPAYYTISYGTADRLVNTELPAKLRNGEGLPSSDYLFFDSLKNAVAHYPEFDNSVESQYRRKGNTLNNIDIHSGDEYLRAANTIETNAANNPIAADSTSKLNVDTAAIIDRP